MYKRLLYIFACLFFVVACSDKESEETIVGASDEGANGIFAGVVDYPYLGRPSEVLVIILNENLEPMDTLSIRPGKMYFRYDCVATGYNYCGNRDVDYGFKTKPLMLQQSYLKIVTRFSMEGSDKKMEFSQYSELGAIWGLYQTLPSAIAFDRITDLYKNEGMSLAEAAVQAYKEIVPAFDLQDLNFEMSSQSPNSFYYCRHFVSDSVFYSDFLELREMFRKNGAIDSTVKLRVADDLLKLHKYTKKGFSDISKDAGKFDGAALMRTALGVSLKTSGVLDKSFDTVSNRNSEFCGARFLYDKNTIKNPSFGNWRLLTPMEDSLGACFAGSDSVQIYRGKNYACNRESMTWEMIEDLQTFMNFKYGVCDERMPYYRPRFLNDTLYNCVELPDGIFRWEKFQYNPDSASSSLRGEVNIARALWEVGTCDSIKEAEGKTFTLSDGTLMKCNRGSWREISAVEDSLKECKTWLEKAQFDGRYWKCVSADYGYAWSEISGGEFYGGDCDRTENKKVVLADSVYFICEAPCTSSTFCAGSWKKLSKEEQIPPILNQDACDQNHYGLLKKYGDDYYLCSENYWIKAPDSVITEPVKDGFICVDSLFGVEKKYGDVYYACASTFGWEILNGMETARRNYAEKYGTCDTITGKSIYWDEEQKTLFGCAVPRARWSRLHLASSPFTPPAGITEEKLAGGKYLDNSNYSVTIDGVDYVFWRHDSTLSVSKVNVGETTYDAYFYKSRMFIHSERELGKNTFLPSNYARSESFADFRDNWQWRATKTNECRGEYGTAGTPYAIAYSENSYVDWNVAMNFCPEGFHIPDTLEFMSSDFLAYPTNLDSLRNDCPIRDHYNIYATGCNRDNYQYYSILWTATEKNSETQYCYEYAYYATGSEFEEKVRRIIDCPKDVNPMVQVVCVRD